MIEIVAFDADDTLWHSEGMFHDAATRMAGMVALHASPEAVYARLHEIETGNHHLFGYGAKGFTLSMVEAAIELSGGRIGAIEIGEIIAMGKAMLECPVDLLDGVPEVLEAVGRRYPLYLVTKGDPVDQRRKISKSGLAGCFERIEVVQEKKAPVYRDLFDRHGVDPASVMMVGNSVPSDVLPVIELGGRGVYIPYVVTASFERHREDPEHDRFHKLESIRQLPGLLDRLAGPLT
jgi:putative hydrolase of the HAD superfamily